MRTRPLTATARSFTADGIHGQEPDLLWQIAGHLERLSFRTNGVVVVHSVVFHYEHTEGVTEAVVVYEVAS